jgi:hypothetical protein
MKKFKLELVALQLIVLQLTPCFIFGIEEERARSEPIFFQLDSDQQLNIIEQGIKSILNSNPYPIISIIQAFKYLDKAITANEFLYSKRDELKGKIKLWAQEKFA